MAWLGVSLRLLASGFFWGSPGTLTFVVAAWVFVAASRVVSVRYGVSFVPVGFCAQVPTIEHVQRAVYLSRSECAELGLFVEGRTLLVWPSLLVALLVRPYLLNKTFFIFSWFPLYSPTVLHATMCISRCFCSGLRGFVSVTMARSFFLITVFFRLSVSSVIVSGSNSWLFRLVWSYQEPAFG